MEDRGFFNRSDLNSQRWKIEEITEQQIFKYDIYTTDPLLVKFDEKGDLEYAKNIKAEEIDQLAQL
jgi:bisphosphoglycerate-dependent phosphoglycerate mutase